MHLKSITVLVLGMCSASKPLLANPCKMGEQISFVSMVVRTSNVCAQIRGLPCGCHDAGICVLSANGI